MSNYTNSMYEAVRIKEGYTPHDGKVIIAPYIDTDDNSISVERTGGESLVAEFGYRTWIWEEEYEPMLLRDVRPGDVLYDARPIGQTTNPVTDEPSGFTVRVSVSGVLELWQVLDSLTEDILAKAEVTPN